MRPIQTFTVVPSLPERLSRLRDVAYNLRWSWNPDAIALIRRLAGELWEESGHNPVWVLGRIDQERLADAAEDEGFVAHLERVVEELDSYMTGERGWFEHHDGSPTQPLAAYFSAEFGITDCLSIFAGGLGLLAGDHLKACSDLGVPIVGVGLLYQQGYFRQALNDAGWQQERYEDNDFHTLPLTVVTDEHGAPLMVESPHPGRQVITRVWKAQVGRVPLYLLDANIPENRPEDRDITDQLYGGDQELRIRQEILLGIGGCRALQALGIVPAVYHMNEGHSAFLTLERVRQLMHDQALPFGVAREIATAGMIFTTHTPVPAGHDAFPPWLIERYLGGYAGQLGLSLDDLLALGRKHPGDPGEPFGMTALALRLAAAGNAVSDLHGEVSREMWQELWPGVPVSETPIGSILNGVHLRSWVSHELDGSFDRYLSPRWREEPADATIWRRLGHIPDEELWRVHERRRESLVSFARRRLRAQLERRGASMHDLDAAGETLDPEVLTIGFARRFATYKRATLLLRDPERLERILNHPRRPVQVIFSGKAHPRDDAGKELIRQIVVIARQSNLRNRIVFLEDYDLAVARFMVQGCDVWLNTPRRPMEASGTSGMKAATNGVLNVSTLDGWWDEVWRATASLPVPIGWAIGRGERYNDPAYQDQVEAEALYNLLETEIAPLFYERGVDRLPRDWIERMQASIATLAPVVNVQRMVAEYAEHFYVPLAERAARLIADDAARARALAEWKTRVHDAWSQVRVESVAVEPVGEVPVGTVFHGEAVVQLGALHPEDVAVELYLGRVGPSGDFVEPGATRMQPVGPDGGLGFRFAVEAPPCRTSGLHGYTVRVIPQHPDLGDHFLPGLIAWA